MADRSQEILAAAQQFARAMHEDTTAHDAALLGFMRGVGYACDGLISHREAQAAIERAKQSPSQGIAK